jgi:hypothetical protein
VGGAGKIELPVRHKWDEEPARTRFRPVFAAPPGAGDVRQRLVNHVAGMQGANPRLTRDFKPIPRPRG